MANGQDMPTGGGPESGPNADDSAAPPSPPGGPPPGGGPILAGIMRQQQGPQISAPGPGDQAGAISMISHALGMLEQALPGLRGTPAYRDVAKAVQSLSRHVAQGAPTAGVQQTQLQDMLRNVMRSGILSRIMQQQQQQPGGQGAGGPAPPMPSTPLPGA